MKTGPPESSLVRPMLGVFGAVGLFAVPHSLHDHLYRAGHPVQSESYILLQLAVERSKLTGPA